MQLKKLPVALAFGAALAAAPVQAGGLSEPVMEVDVIEEQATTSGGYIVPLLIIALLIAITGGKGGGFS